MLWIRVRLDEVQHPFRKLHFLLSSDVFEETGFQPDQRMLHLCREMVPCLCVTHCHLPFIDMSYSHAAPAAPGPSSNRCLLTAAFSELLVTTQGRQQITLAGSPAFDVFKEDPQKLNQKVLMDDFYQIRPTRSHWSVLKKLISINKASFLLKRGGGGSLKNKSFRMQRVKVLCVAASMKETCEAHWQPSFEHHPQTVVSASAV